MNYDGIAKIEIRERFKREEGRKAEKFDKLMKKNLTAVWGCNGRKGEREIVRNGGRGGIRGER